MPDTNFLSLIDAKPTSTVLDNLQGSSVAVKSSLSDALNSALKSQLLDVLTKASLPAIPGLVEHMPSADIVAVSSLSIQAFLKQQLDPMVAKDPVMQQAVDGELAKLSDTTTVGTLLQLNTPLRDHPLFKADVIKSGIVSLLATTPTVGTAPLQNPVREAVSKFLAYAKDFDFQTTRIDSYLRDNASPAVPGLAEETKPAVINQLKRIQRVFRVTPQPEAIAALLGQGLDSAHAISSVPRATFVKQFSDKLGGTEQAKAIHSQATVMQASALNLYRQVQSALTDVNPRAVGPVATGVTTALKALPSWETLFGSLSFCNCQECQSVLGAAAYFVDVLQFLKKSSPNDKGQTPLDILLTRRPNLPFIRLNCHNTNTLLPYVDLVNEILEAYVANSDPKITHSTGDASADELSLNPQYVIDQAYVTLSQAVYPFTLPFDRPLEMSRAYLKSLGSSRYEVMSTFQVRANPPDFTKGTPSGIALSCEYLGISGEEHVILTGTDLSGNPVTSSRALAEFYGFPKTTTDAALVAALQPAQKFLTVTGFSYVNLVELVKTRFVNPSQAVTLQVPSDADPCDLSKTTLNGLDARALQRMHRFLRLQTKTDWSMDEVDKTILALGSADIDDALLVKLAFIKRLQGNLSLSPTQLASFWSTIDVSGRDSLFLQLFQNKTVLSPVDTAFALLYSSPLAVLPAGVTAASLVGVTSSISYGGGSLQFTGVMTEDQKTQLIALATTPSDPNYAAYLLAIDNLFQARSSSGLKTTGGKISPHLPAILAALRISSTDLAVLAARIAGTVQVIGTGDGATATFTGTLPAPFIPGSVTVTDRPGTVVGTDRVTATITGPGISGIINYQTGAISGTYTAAPATGGKITVAFAPDVLDLPTLSQFYRFTALAKALRVSVADLGCLEKLAGANLIQPIDPASLSTFADKAEKVLRSAFSVAQLNYLYCGINDPDRRVAPLDGNVILFLTSLQTALNKVTDGTSVIPDQATGIANTLQQKLAAVLDAASITKTMGFLDGTFQFSADLDSLPAGLTLPAGITYDSAGKKLNSQGAISDLERQTLKALSDDGKYGIAVDALYQLPVTFINSTFSTFLNPADAVSQLINNPSLSTADKQKYVLVRLLTRTNIIKQALTGNLGLDLSITELLLETVLKSSFGNGNAIRDFLALAPPYPGNPVWTAYQLMFKAALLVKGFRMTVKEVTYLSANGSDFANFDLNALPVDSVQPTTAQPTALFTQWLRLYDLFTVRDGVADGEALFDVFQTAAHPSGPPPTLPSLAAQLAAATGWDTGETQILTGPTGFNLTVNDFGTEIKLVPLLACWKLIQRLGVSAGRLFHWAGDTPDFSTSSDPSKSNDLKNANEIKTAARAKFDEQTWLTAAKVPINRLRDAQRTALTAFVQNALQFNNSGQLFDYFLIDVEMSSCMMTSRIVKAIDSVQLFVQRCLMNLESNLDANNKENGVSPSAIDSDQWQKWRKYYRVWEANREVFLYPENWIEPELRDDKSPFFKDLENELLQTDVTAQSAEEAFRNYLQKLDEVSRLDIVGMYHDADADVVHVFGRTFHTPLNYYYRQYANGVWTAWERVPLDIQGDDLIPIVYERRLYLFWPIITTKAQENQNSSNSGSPLSHCEIQLAWGRYQNGKWSAKQLSENILFYPTKNGPTGKLPLDIPSSKLPNVESFVFKGIITNQGASGQQLTIQAYVEQAPDAEAPDWGYSPSNAPSTIVVNVTSEDIGLPGVNVSVKSLITAGSALPVAATDETGSCTFNVPTPDQIDIYSVAVSVPPEYWSVSDDSFPSPPPRAPVIVPFTPSSPGQLKLTFKLKSRGTGDYSQFAEFRLNECAGAVASAYVTGGGSLALPPGTHRDGMMLGENLVGSPLPPTIPIGFLKLLASGRHSILVLRLTPTAFRLLPPHQLTQFLLPPPISAAALAIAPGAATHVFALSPSGLTFDNQQVGTTSAAQTVTFLNTAGVIENASVSITGANAAEFTQSNTCANITGGGTCTIAVTFSPSAPGSRNAVLTVTVLIRISPSQVITDTQTVVLSGAATGVPNIGLAPSTVDFRNQAVGATSGTQLVMVTSTGTAPLFLTSITASGDFAATNSCLLNPAPANCMSMYPSGYVPFSSVFYTSAPDVAGNRVVVGSMTVAAYQGLRMVPMPNVTNQVFCAILQLAPGVFVQAYVPTAAERQGDFSSFTVPLTDPTNNQPFPGNVIPPNRIPGVFGWRITSLTPVSVSGSCKLQVSFTPTASGPRTGTLTITDNATGSPHTITLSGTGVVPSVDLSPSALDFGGQAVGSASAPQTVILTNTSDVVVTITNVGISGANSGDFTLLNNCGASLLAKASCSMSVTFKPSAGGSRSATLTVTDNATGASQTVALRGVGVVPGIAIYPPSLTFGHQPVSTTSAPQTVTLTNTGNSQLTITSITSSGDFVQTNNYSGVVMPSASCTINVTFTPTTRGARTGTLTIVDSSPGSPQTINLAGVGTQPAVTLSPTSLAFTAPTVGTTSPPQTVTLKNSGTAPLNIIGVSIRGADLGDFFYTFSGGNTLAPGDSIPIIITFRPSGGGTGSGQLVITDDASGSPHAVNLTGNVSGADLSLSPTMLTFARQAVGTTSPPQAVTVVNSGGSPLTINSISISGDFAQATSCGNSVVAGASCAIAVTFKPTGGGTRTGALTIVDSAPGSPHTVSLVGSGLYSESFEFFYQDDQRTYYVSLPHSVSSAPSSTRPAVPPAVDASPQIQFYNHFHPHICALIKALNRDGIPGLLTLANQQLTNDVGPNTPTVFETQYSPVQSVAVPPYPLENVDFSYGGAYDLYNWETFFHAPMLVAGRLAANQKFQDAQQWYHYIFNPTLGNNIWQVLPFRTTAKDSIEELLKLLEYPRNDPNIIQNRNNFENQLNEWVKNPFNPHAIARLRLIAYQKNVVMKYLDNLIAWGDQLFRQYTMETVNQATQLYVMAQEILGPRPQLVPSRESAQDKTYNDLSQLGLDDFSNKLVQLENEFPFSVGPASNSGGGGLGLTGAFYFCIPNNAQLLAYWDTVADRLFKIRHCMNIEGVVSPLPLFAPPISPGLLVRAAAEGVDLASALNDIEAATPYYRFTYMFQKAFELCSEVRAFGASLLAALEKKDSEQLALLRATQETTIQNAVLNVRQ